MGPGQVPFEAHIELLHSFLAHRDAIVERIQGLLNAQRKPPDYRQDGALLSRHFEDCVFAADAVTPTQSRLKGQLDAAHWASGFRPRELPGLHNGLIDPAEMMMRGFFLWEQTRWPGRGGRLRYAHTLFNLYVVRSLELLSMRLWDDGAEGAGGRLSQLQQALDHLWRAAPAGQPVFVRDARWLIPLAQSPATDDLGAYFDVAEKIATLPDADRLAVHAASVRLAAGHLRSQTRYYALKKGVTLDEQSLFLSTRGSNALDFALLVHDLVPLLEAYEHAGQRGDRQSRLDLADTICQGISPDPELFLNRVELLGAYSMIEPLFVTTDDDGQAAYTPMGRRHVQLLHDYEARIGRMARALQEDCAHFRPIAGAYSPYGAMYGFASDLLEHMALKATQPDAVTAFSLEDVFASGDGDRLAWVDGWRKLPHLAPDVIQQFHYPQRFAEEVFGRVERALSGRDTGGGASSGVRTGRLFILAGDDQQTDSTMSMIPDLPARFIESSRDGVQILADRREGRSVLSYRTPGGWVAISKAVLTDVLGAGRDAKIAGLPPAAAGALKLMCCKLVSDQDDDHDSKER